MELRSVSHLYFIWAIKNGLIVKLLNVDSRGTLKFKKVKDLYETEDGRNFVSSTLQPKTGYGGLLFDRDSVKIESPPLPAGERKTIASDQESSIFNYNGDNDERNSNSDDFNFGNMTLKQLKERCKTKKRKLSKFLGLTKESVDTFSCVKLENHSLQPEVDELDLKEPLISFKSKLYSLQPKDDELDLKEPLINWKSKLSKNLKTKKKRTNKHTSKTYKSAVSVVKSEQVSNNHDWQSCVQLPATSGIKVEVPGLDYSDSQNMICFADDSSHCCNEQLGFCGKVSNEMLETANGQVLESGKSISCREEAQNCAVNEVSYEYVDHDEPNSHPNVSVTGRETVNADTPEMTCHQSMPLPVSEFKKCINKPISKMSQSAASVVKSEQTSNNQDWQSCVGLPVTSDIKVEVPGPDHSDSQNMISFVKTANGQVLESGVSNFSREEPQNCIVNEVSCEYVDHEEPNSCPNVRVTVREIVNMDTPEMTCHQSLPLPVSEFKEGGHITHPSPSDIYQGTLLSTNDCSSDIDDSSQSCSFLHEMSWETERTTRVQVPDMAIDNSLRCMERSYGVGGCVAESNKTDALAPHLKADCISNLIRNRNCSSPWDSHQCLSPNSCLVSVEDDSSITEGKQSLMPVNADAPIKCPAGGHVFYANDELTTLAMDRNYHHPTLEHPPERLLSTRKAISPTSQERLCQAMRSIELDGDIKHYKSKGKLCFGNPTENKASSAGLALEGAEFIINPKRPEQVTKSEVTVKFKHIVRKPKIDKKGSHPKGILKVPHHSQVLTPLITECTSVQSCSQSAIAFSQRQMHDIECLATKLMKELKAMKDILEGTLHPEACPATSLKDNVDEARMAIKNATKVEETARRWLSMMGRDCNRFCKIMRSTEKGAAASGNVVQKERKKITFADEVGRVLCHVKVFEDGMASPLTSKGENEQLQDQ